MNAATQMKTLFAFAGNARTFLDCMDSIHDNVITKMVSNNNDVYLYFYMKLSSPPKGNHQYPPVCANAVLQKLSELEAKGFRVSSTLLHGDELSNEVLLSQVARREMYIDELVGDGLARAMQCHYNLERVGEWISTFQQTTQIQFDRVIYIRPDLYFHQPCLPLHMYSNTKVTLALNNDSDVYPSDLLAIIPRSRVWDFFHTPMHVYRTNVCAPFFSPQHVLWASATPYEARRVGYSDIRRTAHIPEENTCV
jgi:hypothetical protein